ncbi:amidase [Thalassiella azotivora]
MSKRPAASRRLLPGLLVPLAAATALTLTAPGAGAAPTAPDLRGVPAEASASVRGGDAAGGWHDAGRWDGAALDAATIPDLQREMEAGRLTSTRLTAAYLYRVLTVDPQVDAVLEVNRRALLDAVRSDLHRHRHGPRSPLEGVPVLLKDNIDTRAQGATAGSRALLRSRPDDATIVDRLQAAGAVVLGKANLSEWANFRGYGSSSGWSAVGGQTSNPYVLDRNPCGSSSGSAAAVAASLAQVSVGTETNGSIVCPAGATGIVGHKPTLGLVSRDGIVPISAEQDTAGPMARHVVDAAITLAVLQGGPTGADWVDPADPATRDVPGGTPTDYAALLDAGSLEGARIGVWRLDTGSPETDAVTEQAVQALRDAGATPVDVRLPYQDVVGNDSFTALVAEFQRDVEAYLQSTPGRHPRTLAGLIEFNRQDPVELRYFGQELFEEALAAPDADSPEIQAARERARTAARASIDETMAAHDLDAIMAPTNSPAWETDLEDGDDFLFGSSSPAAVAGYPNVTVPAGYVGKLPVGMSFMAGRWQDATVLSLAYSFEQQTQVRRAPRYLPTVD